MVIFPLIASSHSSDAAEKKTTRVIRPLIPSPEKDAAIVVDGATGRVLYTRNPDAIRYPASLTKMMTLYLLFEALDEGKLSLDTPLITSVHASEQEPTKLAMGPGAAIPVETAIKALTVLSANDVAVVIAEALSGGSEEVFGAMMTEKARQLGMTHTNFHNASGLPDLQQLTTARDMALLARHLAYDFPQYFHYFSAPGFTYNGRSYATHDNLLAAFGGTDGIKTGYTQLSGFNLVTSVVRNNKHVIGVVMGGPTAAVRDHEMMRLLAATFDVAKDNPTLLADADVPWKGGKGPEGQMFAAQPEDYSAILLAAFDPKTKSKSKNPILLAEAKDTLGEPVLVRASQGPAMVPILKPATATAQETQTTTAVPTLTHDGVIEALQHDPTRMPPLRLGPSIALRMPDNSAPVAQGDGGGAASAPAIDAPPVLPRPVAIAAPTIPAPAISDSAPVFASPVLASNSTVKRWAIQVGAFANETLARAKLATFVRHGMDVVGQAERLVVPFAAGDGHILYRARLGMFGESEARNICRRMVQRGEACIAAPADAG
ncbi:MAG TPA: serine hydrolase [Micropepsaceae bacterium]|nr:serine hydrolase [Micropepsaceae bacterium]